MQGGRSPRRPRLRFFPYRDIALSAPFCLGRWKSGRMGRSPLQQWWKNQISVNKVTDNPVQSRSSLRSQLVSQLSALNFGNPPFWRMRLACALELQGQVTSEIPTWGCWWKTAQIVRYVQMHRKLWHKKWRELNFMKRHTHAALDDNWSVHHNQRYFVCSTNMTSLYL